MTNFHAFLRYEQVLAERLGIYCRSRRILVGTQDEGIFERFKKGFWPIGAGTVAIS